MKENETNKERIAGTVVQTKNVFDFNPVNSEMCVPVLYDCSMKQKMADDLADFSSTANLYF